MMSIDVSNNFILYVKTFIDYIKSYKYSDNPTSDLFDLNLSIRYPILVNESRHKIYNLGELIKDIYLGLELYKTSLSLIFVDKDGIQLNRNNVSFSWDRSKKMYVYGIKTNDMGAFVNGRTLNLYCMLIAKTMHITEIYVGDSAGVKCSWNTNIEIEHFTIARIIAGKQGYYESALIGHYLDKNNAELAKQYLIENSSDVEKCLCKLFVKNIDTCTYAEILEMSDTDKCERVKNIISKYEHIIKIKFNSSLFKYIATPQLYKL